MGIELHSRVVRIGGDGCGYRDIVVHEMTEPEIYWLTIQRWLFALAGVAIGAGTIAFYAFRQFIVPLMEHCKI